MLRIILTLCYIKPRIWRPLDWMFRPKLCLPNWQSILMLNILIIASFFVKYSSLIILLFAGLYDLLIFRKRVKILIATYLLPTILIGCWMLFCLKNSGNITGDGFENSETLITISKQVFVFCSHFVFPFSFFLIILGGLFFSKKAYL